MSGTHDVCPTLGISSRFSVSSAHTVLSRDILVSPCETSTEMSDSEKGRRETQSTNQTEKLSMTKLMVSYGKYPINKKQIL